MSASVTSRSITVFFLAALASSAILLAACQSSRFGANVGPVLTGSGNDVIDVRTDPETAEIGGELTYGILVKNPGEVTISGATLEVQFAPEKFSVLSAQGGVIQGDRIVWSQLAAAPKETRTLQFSGIVSKTVATGSTLPLSVTVTAPGLGSRSVSLTVPVGSSAKSVSISSVNFQRSSSSARIIFSTGTVLPPPSNVRASSSSTSAVAPLFPAPGTQAFLRQEVSLQEAQPGEIVHITMSVHHPDAPKGAILEAQVPVTMVDVTNAGGGAFTGDTIRWSIAPVRTVQVFTYEARLKRNLTQGDILPFTARVNGYLVPQATSVVRVIKHLPATGSEGRFTAPLEDTGKFLKPYRK